MITGTQVKDAMEAANVNFVVVRECSICNAPIGYERKGENLFFDGNCGCSSFRNPTQSRNYEDVADLINRQSNSEYKTKLANKFGLQLEAI